ncbi:conserved domain protein [Prevotella denticola CRIS 18C-A]|uniref:Conserved domain protein n=1 Tax=Prevotella denticola CRIS 18C-A TaxID=944557 RepID=F0H872_9BACT|nr:conserved domain protein [Prevotella denticola CRIS 18C-A]
MPVCTLPFQTRGPDKKLRTDLPSDTAADRTRQSRTMFPTPGNTVPDGWDTCSQRLGTLFPAAGCSFPNANKQDSLPTDRNRDGTAGPVTV